MSYRTQSFSLALSRKALLQRALFVALAVMSLALIYAERQQKDWITKLRLSLLQVSAPMAQLLASPGQAIEDLSASFAQHWTVYSENRQLQFDNAQLMQWRDVALRLEAENAALRQLMRYAPADQISYQSAKVMSGAGSLSHRLSLNLGHANGIERHMPVINAQGLIGRTLRVSAGQSEVMLLTDISSRIPVVLQPSGMKAMLVGDHSNLPYLKFADAKAAPPLGEVVMSADDGGLLPGGLHVGSLFAQTDGRYEVLPAFKDARLDYVRVLTRK